MHISYLDRAHTLSSILAIGAVLLSFVVLFEPAPSDILAASAIVLGLPFIIYSHRTMPGFILTTFAIFLGVNMLGAFWHGQLFSNTVFMAITFYLVIFFFNLVGLGSTPGKSLSSETGVRTFGTYLPEVPFSNSVGRWLFISYFLSSVLTAVAIWVGLIKGVLGQACVNNLLVRYYRPKGLFKDPNVTASYLIFPVIWLTSITLSAESLSSKKKALFWVLYLFMLDALFYCSSRASVLGWAIAYFLLLFLTTTDTRKKLKHFLITVCFMVLIAPLPYLNYGAPFDIGARVMPHLPVYRSILNDIGVECKQSYKPNHLLTKYDTGGRLYAWMAAWEIFKDYPIIGSGPGTFEKLSPPIEDKLGVVEVTPSAHNTYLRVLAENGSVGFISFIGAIWATLILCMKKGIPKQSPWILAAFIGILINAFFIDALHWRHLWIIWALLILLCSQNRIQSIQSLDS